MPRTRRGTAKKWRTGLGKPNCTASSPPSITTGTSSCSPIFVRSWRQSGGRLQRESRAHEGDREGQYRLRWHRLRPVVRGKCDPIDRGHTPQQHVVGVLHRLLHGHGRLYHRTLLLRASHQCNRLPPQHLVGRVHRRPRVPRHSHHLHPEPRNGSRIRRRGKNRFQQGDSVGKPVLPADPDIRNILLRGVLLLCAVGKKVQAKDVCLSSSLLRHDLPQYRCTELTQP